MHPKSKRFHYILKELGDLHDTKAKDYGVEDDPYTNIRNSEDFGIPAWIGCSLRANDKMKRIQTASIQALTTQDVALANESLEDSLRDLAVYAVLGLVMLEEWLDTHAT